MVKEEQIEYGFIGKLQGLKYEYRADIRDRVALEENFREKFEALNRIHLTNGEFAAPSLASIDYPVDHQSSPVTYLAKNV